MSSTRKNAEKKKPEPYFFLVQMVKSAEEQQTTDPPFISFSFSLHNDRVTNDSRYYERRRDQDLPYSRL